MNLLIDQYLASVILIIFIVYSYIYPTSYSYDAIITSKQVEKFERSSPLVNEWLVKSYFPNTILQSIYPNSTIPNSDHDISNRIYWDLQQEYDPRLLPSLWINSILNNLKNDHDHLFNPEISLPFSWNSLLGIDRRLKSIEVGMDLHVLNCEKFAEVFGLDYSEFSKSCISLKGSPRNYPKLKITRPVDDLTYEEGRKIIGLSHLLHEAPIPHRLALLGVGPEQSSLIVPLMGLGRVNAYSKGDLNYLISNYLDNISQTKESPSNITNSIELGIELHNLKSWWESIDQPISYKPSQELKYDLFRAMDCHNAMSMDLKKEEFDIDIEQYINTLQDKVSHSYSMEIINDFDKELLTVMTNNIGLQPNFTKYFNEANCIGSHKGSHYDWRFFKQLRYSEYERKAILHRLTRSWLRFANSVGLSTWLGHGSLLGWYWNGMSLPWDEDLDVQMTLESLYVLARNFNQTLVVDLTDDPDNLNNAMGSYLVDVSSNFFSRDNGNGLNTIDARFIDTNTGFYVDITALGLTNASQCLSSKDKRMKELNQVLDPEFIEKDESKTIESEDLKQSLHVKRDQLVNDRNIFNCRNYHFYTLEDLSPLRKTLFEGVQAYVPNGYKAILEREYTRSSLYSRQHEGHTFRPTLDLWIPSGVCKRDVMGNQCFDSEVLLERKHTMPVTLRHREELNRKRDLTLDVVNIKDTEVLPFRVDPWIIGRCLRLQKLLERF
ncbi:regulator of cell wall mannosyl phosphorylation [Scheffersomyces coipomensis]|uniref:regulator of cell wall mannosyl phosphorylation n=1 Tax=Scheffersomyces coipomensis TaxID=1788519 RepID=UPI00315D42EB